MNSSSTEIKFNKEQANYGIEELRQCQKELYEADKLFYKGIMALASAKGMDLILKEDAGINLYMPEKIVIECREEVANLIEEISTKISLVEGFNEVPKEETVQYRKAEVIEDTVGTEAEPVSKKIVIPGPVQALYAPPGTENPEIGGPIKIPGPIQALYAPPGEEIGPIEGTPVVQPMYGVVTPEQPIVSPIVQPMYGVVTPNIGTGTDTMPVTPPIGINPVVGTPEYETIPNTGIPGVIEKNYISKHPRLIGGLAATIGLFGIPTMLSDDYEELEEKRINEKED